MWIGRRLDNSIYGVWENKQKSDEFHPGLEEVPDNHPDVVAFISKIDPPVVGQETKLADIEARLSALERK